MKILLLSVHACTCCVKLQYLKTYGIRTTNINIYETSAIQLTSVGLAHAQPNYSLIYGSLLPPVFEHFQYVSTEKDLSHEVTSGSIR